MPSVDNDYERKPPVKVILLLQQQFRKIAVICINNVGKKADKASLQFVYTLSLIFSNIFNLALSMCYCLCILEKGSFFNNCCI